MKTPYWGISLESENFNLRCPKCGLNGEVTWFPPNRIKSEVPGTRAGSSVRWSGRGEKVQGSCKGCGYVFKPKDLD